MKRGGDGSAIVIRHSFPAKVAPMSTLAIGHRGAAGHAPENTLASFARAVELDAAGVELDVQLSSDGHVVVFHDDTLDRVTDGKGPLAARTFEELRRLDAGSRFDPAFAGERIPLLREVLEVVAAPRVVNVELKYGPGMAELVAATLAVVRDCAAMERIIFSSFDHRGLALLREQAPAARIGVLLTYGREEKAFAAAERLAAVSLNPPVLSVSKDLVRMAHDRGLAVWTWTGNRPADLTRLVAAGADAIISDYPDRVLAAAAGHESEE
jgi:glycerophosphoryl diester phosphodiesterase